MSFVESKDITTHIFSFLYFSEQYAIRRVCKEWKNIIESLRLFKRRKILMDGKEFYNARDIGLLTPGGRDKKTVSKIVISTKNYIFRKQHYSVGIILVHLLTFWNCEDLLKPIIQCRAFPEVAMIQYKRKIEEAKARLGLKHMYMQKIIPGDQITKDLIRWSGAPSHSGIDHWLTNNMSMLGYILPLKHAMRISLQYGNILRFGKLVEIIVQNKIRDFALESISDAILESTNDDVFVSRAKFESILEALHHCSIQDIKIEPDCLFRLSIKFPSLEYFMKEKKMVNQLASLQKYKEEVHLQKKRSTEVLSDLLKEFQCGKSSFKNVSDTEFLIDFLLGGPRIELYGEDEGLKKQIDSVMYTGGINIWNRKGRFFDPHVPSINHMNMYRLRALYLIPMEISNPTVGARKVAKDILSHALIHDEELCFFIAREYPSIINWNQLTDWILSQQKGVKKDVDYDEILKLESRIFVMRNEAKISFKKKQKEESKMDI